MSVRLRVRLVDLAHVDAALEQFAELFIVTDEQQA